MTIDTMRWHEAVNIHYDHDFRRQSLVQLAKRYVCGPRVLDMRCITGTLAVELAVAGMEVTALDAYLGAVEKTNTLARNRGIAAPIAHHWDLTRLVEQVGVGCFDTVVCLDVLNHVDDDEATMSDIAQVLRSGARLILNVPAFPALLGKRDQSLGHLRRYTRSSLRGLLTRHGFEVETMRYWNFTALPMYAFIERGLRAEISDGFRFGSTGWMGSSFNRVLTWWYMAVENRCLFPIGLSLFVIARKP